MALSVRSNIPSLKAQRSLADATDRLNASTTRLASGLRINGASDDAAGLAIASQLNISSRVYTQAIRNVNDGASLLNIAEGALSELGAITVRQKELAEQSANGVYTSRQREALHREAAALGSEYNRIVASTEMNGIALLDGSLIGGLRIQAGYGIDESISVSIGGSLMGLAGDGTFAPQRTFTLSGAGRPANGDLNGDDREDLVVLVAGQPQILIGNGDGSFQAPISYAGGGTSANVSLADLNRDGSVDFLLPDLGVVHVLMNNGDGTFAARRSYTGPINGLGVQTGDFDEDGAVDLLVIDSSVGSSSVSMLRGNGDGTFKARVTFGLGGQGSSVMVGDLNRDSNLDFYAVLQSGQLEVFLGNGDGSFKTRGSYSGGGTTFPVYTDLNGDYILDHSGVDFYTGNVMVALGNSDGSFRASVAFATGPSPFNLSASDLNGDGSMDLVASNSGNGTASVLLNNGDGSFKAAATYANALRIRLGDFNEDGVTDMVSTSSATNTIGMFLGNIRSTPYLTSPDLTTEATSRAALSKLENNHTRILAELGNIGGTQRRLRIALQNLFTSRKNFRAAESRIMDADFAEEAARSVKNQIVQQAAAAIASQSARVPELILSLIN